MLGRILQRLVDQGYAQVEGYARFGLIELKAHALIVSREHGLNTRIPFQRMIAAITVYQAEADLYDKNPTALRPFGFMHITSPLFALLHLLPKEVYGHS